MPKMFSITVKPLSSGYRLFSLILLVCLSMVACRNDSQPTPSTSLDIATSRSDSATGELLDEGSRLPGRRETDISLSQLLELDMVRSSNEPASLQMPALIESTVAGRDISSVAVVAGRFEDDNSRRLVTYELVEPANSKEVWPIQWPDGIHDLTFVWYTEGDYLSDGEEGDFALLWQIEPGSTLRSTNGRFRRAENSVYEDSVLLVDISAGKAAELLDTETGETIIPKPGDQFQFTNLLLDDTGATITAPGAALTFGEPAQLIYQRRTLPAGDYFLGFTAEAGAGSADSVFADFSVSNETLLPELRAYLQPEYGYQFLYPLTWGDFVSSGQGTFALDQAKDVDVQIAVGVNPDQKNPSKMKEEAINSFGDVQILYEDQLQVGSSSGTRTAYGYESPDGTHTGVLLSFAHAGWDFLIDIDGLASEESSILEGMETIINNWIWRPILSDYLAIAWNSYDIDGHNVKAAAELQHSLLGNGWHRFSDSIGDNFLALRIEPPESGELQERMVHWLEVASRDTANYKVSNIYDFRFSGTSWLRVDFQYNDNEAGELWGTILGADLGTNHLVAWYEASEGDYWRWEENFVTLSLADLLDGL